MVAPVPRARSGSPAQSGKAKGKGKDKGKGGKGGKKRDPSRGRGANTDGNGAEQAKGKTKLFCQSFLDTGTCATREAGGHCNLSHLGAEEVAALKKVYGDDLKGYYSPPAAQ